VALVPGLPTPRSRRGLFLRCLARLARAAGPSVPDGIDELDESIPARRLSCSISASSASITASRSARAASSPHGSASRDRTHQHLRASPRPRSPAGNGRAYPELDIAINYPPEWIRGTLHPYAPTSGWGMLCWLHDSVTPLRLLRSRGEDLKVLCPSWTTCSRALRLPSSFGRAFSPRVRRL
jgi:hypothetical protein